MNAIGGAALVTSFLVTARVLHPSGARGRAAATVRLPQRKIEPTADEWAAFLDVASTEVRSGSSLTSALTHARRRQPALAARFDAAETNHDLAIVRQSVNAATELGGPIAATLHHGAALLRERAAQRAEAATHSAQARLSAKVLTAVPLLFAAWNAAASATFRQAITSPMGLVAAATGLATNATGWWWMHRIVDRAMP